MCRNITELRGLQPPATDEEIEAAALQYVRKVSGLRQPPTGVADAFAAAVAEVAAATHRLLHVVPERRQPPPTVPPLRRPEVRASDSRRDTVARRRVAADQTVAERAKNRGPCILGTIAHGNRTRLTLP